MDQAVLDEVDLPEELANLRYASKYHDLIAYNRVGWALSELNYRVYLIHLEEVSIG